MSDETEAPGEGEAGGLPPEAQAHAARMEDPAWQARFKELEAKVHEALTALLDHTGGAVAISAPMTVGEGKDATTRALVAGDPLALFAVIRGEGPRLLLNKHIIVSMGSPKDLFLAAIMSMIGGGGMQEVEDEDEVPTPGCGCPKCQRLRARDKDKQH